MIIYRAIKRNWRTQGFGKEGTVPRMIEFYKKLGLKDGFHNGWDWSLDNGTPVYWDCDINGLVIDTHIDGSGGLGVKVITQDKDGNFKHLFWHCQGFACKPGDVLKSGDLIGWGDNTGRSTGSHLHRGLKPVYLDNNGNWKNKYPNNGYFGAIDIKPYFKNIYIKGLIINLVSQINILKKLVGLFKQLIKELISI